MQSECLQCAQLLRQFTLYRQQVVIQKQAMRKEVERVKQQLDKFMGKIDKRVDSRIQEQRLVNTHHLQKLQHFHRQQLQKTHSLMQQKDRLIEEMRGLLRQAQRQKRELIQTNTRALVEMGGQLGTEKQQKDKSYWELMKMYQFLIEQNNELKKEMYLLRKGNFSVKEKSLLDSSQKPKSPTVHTSKQVLNSSKSFTREVQPRQKKKIPKPKNTHK